MAGRGRGCGGVSKPQSYRQSCINKRSTRLIGSASDDYIGEGTQTDIGSLATAYINNEVLRWAFQRAGQSPESVAEKLATTEARVNEWISGEQRPSFKQAQRIAKILQIPFGFLYLPEPPKEQIPVVEFRKLPDSSRKMSRDIFDLLSDIEFKRDWYRDFRIEEGFDELDFISRYNADQPATLIASDIRSELGRASNSLFVTRKNFERFLDEFIRAAEKIGIWVMRSGVVGNNTHRTIPIESLRGFAIADKIVPLIFLNGRDAKSAQIFTFAHELAHLWIGESSIDTGDLSDIISTGDQKIEKKCNAIAAEILVPSNEFVHQWKHRIELNDQVDEIADRFSVSRIVIARRALEQNFIGDQDYREFYLQEQKRWSEMDTSRIGGGSYYRTIPSRNGRTFTNAVAREAAVGRIMFREAGQLLGIQPSKVRELYERNSA
ncbi:XRE family transcriptional regulator [Psychromarinibacter sp. C21-152]|uniref:XRE family transcriptional regulator n=1 Tax=Psychromarinibacter sediminicola TaxID=3033385 RepID=A0AAE3NVZ1_9RHOB|nr:XRE family transcriptional regulator [Psychromarinibacter sediminicola]MDF0602684.1 XRE family transcriptional regulator [Psychromarinibacter sediminicola]